MPPPSMVGAPVFDVASPASTQDVDERHPSASWREGSTDGTSPNASSIASFSSTISSLKRAAAAASARSPRRRRAPGCTTSRARARWASRRSGCSAVTASRAIDLLVGEEGEVAEVGADHAVLAAEEELVQSWYGLVRPASSQTVPGLGLAELGPVGLQHQGGGQPPHLVVADLADQIDPHGDVAPLVAAADLEPAAVGRRTGGGSRRPAGACS